MPRATQLSITSLAPGGDGVAHIDIDGARRAVFVRDSAPGDVLRVDVDLSTRPARGRLLEIVAAGSDRVAPPCAWAVRCGGCDWMHLSGPAQARVHVEHVRGALPSEWRDVPIASHPAEATLGHRTRARVHVRSDRGRVDVGIHEAGTHEPVVVERCAVLDPAVDRARNALAALFDGSRGTGDVQIALGIARRPVLEVRWTGDVADACYGRLEAAVRAGELAGARITIGAASRPATIGDPTGWMRGADGEPLQIAPGGFAQASESESAALGQHVSRLVSDPGGARVDRAVELHAGSGNLSVMLARVVSDLVTLESSRASCDAARANLKSRGLSARVVEGDADTYAFSPATRLLILDPPRTGARVIAQRLASSRVARIVYVSCDPQTLGRDLSILAPTYAPRSITTFEMFPQTSHIETVVALDRKRGARSAAGAGGQEA